MGLYSKSLHQYPPILAIQNLLSRYYINLNSNNQVPKKPGRWVKTIFLDGRIILSLSIGLHLGDWAWLNITYMCLTWLLLFAHYIELRIFLFSFDRGNWWVPADPFGCSLTVTPNLTETKFQRERSIVDWWFLFPKGATRSITLVLLAY